MKKHTATTRPDNRHTAASSGRQRVRRFCNFLLLLLLLLMLRLCFTSCIIPSTGMENSLLQGERILVNKWSYGLRVPFMKLFSYQRWRERSVRKEEIVVFNNPAALSQPVIDRREVFIGRCIGIPGDTLLIDSLFTVVSPNCRLSPDSKNLYVYPASKEHSLDSLLSLLSIADNQPMGSYGEAATKHIRSFSRYEYYLLDQSLNGNNWIRPLKEETSDTLRPLVVPQKGKMVRVHPWNMTLLRNTLVMHEGKQAEIKNDTLYVEGRPTKHCYFTKDYYWMISNHTANLSDSRLFGFVPQDHIIGKASLIWFSKTPSTGWFDGYRWHRFFRPVR